MLGYTDREVLRYLGYGKNEGDAPTLKKIALCREIIAEKASLHAIYRQFPIDWVEGTPWVAPAVFALEGQSIGNLLKGSSSLFLFAATIGIQVDRAIQYYMKEDLALGVILDACATAAIESYCDVVNAQLKEELAAKGLTCTPRFSPGYGDLPITLQGPLTALLQTPAKIGLTVTPTSILIPRKSVTAILGVVPQGTKLPEVGCFSCNKFATCQFRKVGENCGAFTK